LGRDVYSDIGGAQKNLGSSHAIVSDLSLFKNQLVQKCQKNPIDWEKIQFHTILFTWVFRENRLQALCK